MSQGFRIEKLRRNQPVDSFACGREDLDRFLPRYAFGNQQANAAQTYLGLHDVTIIGFYSLVVGEVAYGDAPERLTKGLARQARADHVAGAPRRQHHLAGEGDRRRPPVGCHATHHPGR